MKPINSICVLCLAVLGSALIAFDSSAEESPDTPHPQVEPWSPYALVEVHVLDAQTSEPIKDAIAVAGTSYTSSRGWSWQDHTLSDADGNVVRWPIAQQKGYRIQVIRVEASGYVPYHTMPIARADAERVPEGTLRVMGGEPIRLEARLTRDPLPKVRLLEPGGEPAVGGQVAIAMNRREVRIAERRLHVRELPDGARAGERWEQPKLTTTDERGDFRLPIEIAHRAVVVAVHGSGVAVVPVEEFRGSEQLQLEPWGKIRGQAILGGEPASGLRLRLLMRTRLMIDDYLFQRVVTTTDTEGRFTIKYATPGLMHIHTIPDRPEEMDTHPRTNGSISAGGVTRMVYGGVGRPVIGRVIGLDNYEGLIATCELPGPSWRDGGKSNRRFSGFMRSAAGEAFRQTPVEVAKDGTFRFERVSPEFYHVDIWQISGNGDRKRFGVRRQFRFPMLSQSESDLPLDLGEFKAYTPPRNPPDWRCPETKTRRRELP